MEMNTANKVRRPVRRNLEARREQNRQASRIYREKRKQKLDLLESIVEGSQTSSSTQNRISPQEDARKTTVIGSVTDGNGNVASAACRGDAAKTPFIAFDDGAVSSDMSSREWSGQQKLLYPSPWHGSSALDAIPFPFAPSIPFISEQREVWELTDGMAEDGASTGEFISPSMLGKDPSTSSTAAASTTIPKGASPEDEAVLSILESVKALSSSQKTSLLNHLKHQTPSAAPPTTLPGVNWVSHHPRLGPVRSRMQDEARRFAAFIDQHLSGTLSPAQLTRIYVHEVGFFGAAFANCYALGMTDIEPLLVEEGCSPFCIGPETGYAEGQLGIVKRMFEGVTRDLRPVDVQLTFGHHPYLDVLPFKTFRSNALHALMRDSLDEEQLCLDLGAGLVCWGSQQNSMGMEAGVPWDKRSWEPQIWFLQKYQHLVGGWDDEMWECTRWWHRARGHKLRGCDATV